MKSLLLLVLPILVIAELNSTHESHTFEKRVTRFVDDGNLMCLTENYGHSQGNALYFMTLDEATDAIHAVCYSWQYTNLNPSSMPGYKNTVYFIGTNPAPEQPNNVTVSVTYNGGDNCPQPPLNFWYDMHVEYAETYSHCFERLSTIINGCDTEKENEYWKQGGSFFRDCTTWEVSKTLP